MSDAQQLLRRLSVHDEECVTSLLALGLASAEVQALDRRITVLVRLAALLAVGAPTETLRWAVERVAVTGAGDDAILAVLRAAAAAAGSAELVAGARRLGLALDFDVEYDPALHCPSSPASPARATASEREVTPSLR